ncbi:MAG: type III secretion system export apparatus subunit SctR, partial [Pirellulales bacterium]|nr:type III secretion system export apparatus subunit SctR [Pirellulales bacterium]
MEINFTDPVYMVAILVFLGLAPFLAIMVTSYVKIVVVLSLVRNALGIQQIPPNMVINGLAIILSIYIMNPTIQSTYEIFKTQEIDGKSIESIEASLAEAKVPIREFLLKHTGDRERAFFFDSAKAMWPEEQHRNLKDDDLMVLVPAFTVTELTEAFQIGFLVYLPFIVIDIIISNILLAMGMMM